jgi:polyisoprenoid-binding protein YceI
MRWSRILPLLAVLFASQAANEARAEPLKFAVEQAGASKVQFVSDATLEKITGVGDHLSGEVSVDPDVPAQTKGRVKIHVESLRTGLDLRDEHLRGKNWLDASQFPEAVVAISEVLGLEKLKPEQASEVTLKGTLTLHGVTRPLEAKAKVRWTPRGGKEARHTLHVTASFPIQLDQHNVSIPSVVTLKVAREIQVNVDLYAYAN